MLSREWRCSWSSADRRCSNYIWVIDNFIAYQGAAYIRDFTVVSVIDVVFASFCGWGWGAFLRWCSPSVMWAGPLIFHGYHRGCLNNPIFSNLGLYAACWAHFMCHHELWPISVSHPFSSLNSSLGLTGGNYYQKITSLSLDLFFKTLLFHAAFLLFFSVAIFYPYSLLVLRYVALF